MNYKLLDKGHYMAEYTVKFASHFELGVSKLKTRKRRDEWPMKGRELYITLGSFKEYDPMDAHCLISLKAQIDCRQSRSQDLFISPPQRERGKKDPGSGWSCVSLRSLRLGWGRWTLETRLRLPQADQAAYDKLLFNIWASYIAGTNY